MCVYVYAHYVLYITLFLLDFLNLPFIFLYLFCLFTTVFVVVRKPEAVMEQPEVHYYHEPVLALMRLESASCFCRLWILFMCNKKLCSGENTNGMWIRGRIYVFSLQFKHSQTKFLNILFSCRDLAKNINISV